MRILVSCEESQKVTIELRKRGHEAYSCDIDEPSGGHPEWHLRQDVLPLLREKWDMILAFPPCTHLCASGSRYWQQKQEDGRQQEAVDFFMAHINAPCDKIMVENSVGIMSRLYRKPDQIIQPYQFGDYFSKKTCIWLKNLPPLIPDIPEWQSHQLFLRYGTQMSEWLNKVPMKDRSKIKSKTFPGIARAMAEQWG